MEPVAIPPRRFDDYTDDDDEWMNEQDYHQELLNKRHPPSSSPSITIISPPSTSPSSSSKQRRSLCGCYCNYVLLGIFLIGGLILLLDENMMKVIKRKTMSLPTANIVYNPEQNLNQDEYIASLKSKYTALLNQYKSFENRINNLKKQLNECELEQQQKTKNNNSVLVVQEGSSSVVEEGSSKAVVVVDDMMIEEEEVDINESNTISIMSFSNGQTWCDKNALWNAYYQIRPNGIQRIELMLYEASARPSKFWNYWSDKFNENKNFRIQYRWYNSSKPQKTKDNPALGELRNIASDESNGYLLVNFDNDDIYHPNYLKYVIHHLKLNPSWMNIGIACHAMSEFNPDGTYNIDYCDHNSFDVDSKYRTAAHTYSTLKQVFTEHDIKYPTDFDSGSEDYFIKYMQHKELPIGQVDSINYTTTTTTTDTNLGSELLLIKTVSPLSKTSQIFYYRRELFNRMTLDDTKNLIEAMKKYYQDMHELQKPSNIEALSLDIVTKDDSSASTSTSSSSSAIQPMKVRNWKEFHYNRYPNGFGSTTNYPHCEGFAGLMGTRYLPKKNHTKLLRNIDSSKECCLLCSSMDNKTASEINGKHYGRNSMAYRNVSDSIRNNYCGAFTYNTKTKSCQLGLGTISFTAKTAFTFETGIRIDPTCPRCGYGLQTTELQTVNVPPLE